MPVRLLIKISQQLLDHERAWSGGDGLVFLADRPDWQTFSLPFSGSKVDAGHWSRSRVYEGLLRSVQGDAVAALCCCIDVAALARKTSGSAADWVMDLVPEYRQCAVVRRHPVIYSPALGRHEPQLSHELRSVEDKPEA